MTPSQKSRLPAATGTAAGRSPPGGNATRSPGGFRRVKRPEGPGHARRGHAARARDRWGGKCCGRRAAGPTPGRGPAAPPRADLVLLVDQVGRGTQGGAKTTTATTTTQQQLQHQTGAAPPPVRLVLLVDQLSGGTLVGAEQPRRQQKQHQVKGYLTHRSIVSYVRPSVCVSARWTPVRRSRFSVDGGRVATPGSATLLQTGIIRRDRTCRIFRSASSRSGSVREPVERYRVQCRVRSTRSRTRAPRVIRTYISEGGLEHPRAVRVGLVFPARLPAAARWDIR